MREYARAPLTLGEVSQVLWAAQGVTDGKEGLRAAPSAGALYPLEFVLVVGEVEGLEPGTYRYRPLEHDLVRTSGEDLRAELAAAAWGQNWLRKAPLVLAVSAVYERTTKKYGERGKRYVHMDAGCAMENVYLQATALGLGTVTVGAFDDRKVANLLSLPTGERPLALMPMGRPRK